MNVQEHGQKVKFTKFLREVKAEIKKVAWPNKKELQSFTAIVFISVMLVSAVIWAMDKVTNTIISWIIIGG